MKPSKHYLDKYVDRIFKTASHRRDLVVWTPEQIEKVDRLIKNYDMLSRYSFTSD